MGLSVRLAFGGLMALSVGGFAGWLYSADPATVAQASAKLLDAVATIVRLPAKDTPPQEGLPQPSIDPFPGPTPPPRTSAPAAQSGKAATPPAKPQAPPAVDPSRNPEKKKATPKTRRHPAADDD